MTTQPVKNQRRRKTPGDGSPGVPPFPSPQDWRDVWIYFLMLDRFNREDGKMPVSMPYDKPFGGFQGGTFNGVRERLPYLRDLLKESKRAPLVQN